MSKRQLGKFGLLLIFLGLATGLADLLGFFSHPEREALVSIIRAGRNIPASTPGFQELFEAFPPPDYVSKDQVESIGPVFRTTMGDYATSIGPLVYMGGGKTTDRILTFEELEDWANKSTYPWVAWVIILLGFIGVIWSFFLKESKADTPVDQSDPLGEPSNSHKASRCQ